MTRFILVIQLMFFLCFGVATGAFYKELKEQHDKEIAQLLVRIPLASLSEIKMSNL